MNPPTSLRQSNYAKARAAAKAENAATENGFAPNYIRIYGTQSGF